MMRILVVAAGLVIGGFLGMALLLLNPITLTQGKPAGLTGAVSTYTWEQGSGYKGFEMTPSGLLGQVSERGKAFAFKDAGIRYARAEVMSLAGEAGSGPALAIRLSAIARPNSLLQARLGVTTAWNVLWPGRGSVLLAGSENFWAPVRDGLWSAMRGRGFAPGQARYPLPPVPGMGSPRLISGSGEFAGAEGGFREEFSPLEDKPANLVGLRQLHLAIE